MSDTTALRVADLSNTTGATFDLRPGPDEMAGIAAELGLSGLRKLRFSGRLDPSGPGDWVLTGRLGATVVQPCIVTLDPVTTRLDVDVARRFLADMPEPDGDEVEMPEDEDAEPLGTHIDPGAIMIEALALAVPQYPRKEGTELGEAVFTEPGRAPMRDEDARPFAGLAGLRDAMKGKNGAED